MPVFKLPFREGQISEINCCYLYDIRCIHKESWDQELANDLVKFCNESFFHIPDEFKTEEMCERLANRPSLPYIKKYPEKFITKEIALKYIKRKWTYIQYVPKELIDKDMILFFLEQIFTQDHQLVDHVNVFSKVYEWVKENTKDC